MGMFDFRDVQAAGKAEQIRAYSVEQALEHFERSAPSGHELLCVAKMIEDYITNGDVTGVITSAVEEGYSEGRLEVYQHLTEKGLPMTGREMRELFIEKGWLPDKPEPGTVQNY